MSDKWDYEMALKALALLQRQGEPSGGLWRIDGKGPLIRTDDLQDLIDAWADFFKDRA